MSEHAGHLGHLAQLREVLNYLLLFETVDVFHFQAIKVRGWRFCHILVGNLREDDFQVQHVGEDDQNGNNIRSEGQVSMEIDLRELRLAEIVQSIARETGN